MADAVPGTPRPVVLDTNVALDLLLFDDPACTPLAAELAAGALQWIATERMREEFARVLAYPLIVTRLAERRRVATALLGAYDAQVRLQAAAPCAPYACKDPDDQVFIDLALAHGALLLSKDKAVLALRRRLCAAGITVAPSYAAALAAA